MTPAPEALLLARGAQEILEEMQVDEVACVHD
eukprot:CAMPEP_0115339736 /NCGR_PEP_ID=MMETSP0270-20121206/90774_1 /TAXON_ID=71861 /ORGANISM="Scrippsiella trochoidea, Strain CCMP3099" /LENGTH=31 /DNA_ID= /DNA_START= /DNA_END= /DNA_ORIENTATION=